jgi:integrase/recombinase XerD
VRNRALFATLYRAGLRITEALSLMPKDIDLEGGTIRVLHGKGDRARTVGVDTGATELITEWLTVRRDLGVDGQAPLFCTLSGKPMGASYVRASLKRLACRAGVAKRVHPHGFRHTHAAQLAAENVPINVIQAQLGHSNVATTSRYLQHIAPQQVISIMRQRQWQLQV